MPAAAELLLDDELLDGAGVSSPGSRPVGHGVARLDHAAPSARTSPERAISARKSRTGSLKASASGGRSTDRTRRTPRRVLSATADRGSFDVEQRAQRGGPADEEVGVMLPGHGDPAVDLGVQLRAAIGGVERQRGGHRRGQGRLLAAGARCPSGVPHGADRQLGGGQHVGAVMLDGLEGADGATELQPGARVLGGLGGARDGHSHGLCRAEQASSVDEDASSTWEDHRRGMRRSAPTPRGEMDRGSSVARPPRLPRKPRSGRRRRLMAMTKSPARAAPSTAGAEPEIVPSATSSSPARPTPATMVPSQSPAR